MKKFLLCFLVLAFTIKVGIAQVIQFEDNKFKHSLIHDQDPSVDINHNGQIEVWEAEAYGEEIRVSNKGITSVAEIRYFKVLPSFHCDNNQITSLDLSQTPKLKILNAGNNQISSVSFDLSKPFTSIILTNNKLTSLVVPATGRLDCGDNPLNTLDVSRCTSIATVDITNTNITSLDLSKSDRLREVNVRNNKLHTLLVGYSNMIHSFDCSNNQLTSLDAKQLSGVLFDNFNCSNNKIVDLKLGRRIKHVQCANNDIINIELEEGSTQYQSFNCSGNKLSIGELWDIKKNSSNLSSFDFSNQRPVTSSATHETEIVYTCSEAITMNGNTTTFNWFKNNSPASSADVQTVSNGKYIFNTVGSYYYTCTNATFPGVTSKVFVTVVENGRLDQEISIGELPDYIERKRWVTFNASTSAPGLEVVYTVTPSSYARNGNQFYFQEYGDYTIVLSQPGNDQYNPAPNKSFTITSSKKQNTIRTVDYPEVFYVNKKFYFRTYASGSLDVECTIEPGEGVDHYSLHGHQQHGTFTQEGTYTVRLNQPGNDEYAAAPEVVLNAYVKKRDLMIHYYNGYELPETAEVDKRISFMPIVRPVMADNEAPDEEIVTVTPDTYEYDQGNHRIKFLAAGTYTVTVSNPGNESYYPIEETYTINITKRAQELSFGYIQPNLKVGANSTIRSSASSGLDVEYTFSPNTVSPTDDDERFVFQEAGTYTLTLNQAGNDKYFPAEEISTELTVGKGDQNVYWSGGINPRNSYVNESVTFNATVASGLPLTYSATPDTYTIEGNVMTFLEAGQYTVKAYQPGNENYNASNEATYNFSVRKRSQYITIGDTPDAEVLTPITFDNVTTSAVGLSPVFTISEDIATVNGNEITFKKGGSHKVTVSCPGNTEYNPAPEKYFYVSVLKKSQTISVADFNSPVYVNDPVFIDYSTDAEGLEVNYSVSSTSYSEENKNFTFKDRGNFKITFSQAGNDIYNKATNVEVQVEVVRKEQNITVNDFPTTGLVNDPITIDYSTDAEGLEVDFNISPSTYTKEGNAYTFTQAGDYTVTLAQAGNVEYNPAETIVKNIAVSKKTQEITVNDFASSSFVNDAITIEYSTDAEGLEVDFNISPSSYTKEGNAYTFTQAGDYTITLAQAGNDEYASAETIVKSITVSKKTQEITVNDFASSSFVNDAITIEYSTDAEGLEVDFNISPSTYTQEGNAYTFTQAGDYTVTLAQAGNDEYAAAETIVKYIAVSKKTQEITVNDFASSSFVNDAITIEYSTDAEGLEVEFNISPSTYTQEGNAYTFTQAGDYTITLAQAGNDEYAAAETIVKNIAVSKRAQEITVGFIPEEVIQSKAIVFDIHSISEELVLEYTITPNSYSVNGNEYTFQELGQYSVIVSQSGNDEYEAAADVTFDINVVEEIIMQDQTISIGTLPEDIKINTAVQFNASSSVDGLEVVYTTEPATSLIEGNQITFQSAGEYTIKLNQPGNEYYHPAPEVSYTVEVNKLGQIITFGDIPVDIKIGEAVEFHASSDIEGMEITYSVDPNTCTIDNNMITFEKEGTYTVKAIQAGDDIYAAAEASVEVEVKKPVGLAEVDLIQVEIYPNPMTDHFYIQFNRITAYNFSIYDIEGNVMIRRKATGENQRINSSTWRSGIYILEISTDKQQFRTKLVK